MENFHRLLQLSSYRCNNWRKNLYHARGSLSRLAKPWTNKKSHATNRRSWHWYSLLLSLPLIYVGLLCDLLWSDPDKDITGWSENDRGVSFTFGPDVVARFLQKHDMDLICRAHQVVEDGYEFFAKRQLVTLFSAPNYCGEFDNAGAMMSVDESLMCSFQVCCLVLFDGWFCRFWNLQRRNQSINTRELGWMLEDKNLRSNFHAGKLQMSIRI